MAGEMRFEDMREIVQALGPKEALGNLKVPDLKEAMKRFGLKPVGTKLDLIRVLGKHLLAEPADPAPTAASRRIGGAAAGSSGRKVVPAEAVSEKSTHATGKKREPPKGGAAGKAKAAKTGNGDLSTSAAVAQSIVAPVPTPARKAARGTASTAAAVEAAAAAAAASAAAVAATLKEAAAAPAMPSGPPPKASELPEMTRDLGPAGAANFLLGLKVAVLREYCTAFGFEAIGTKLVLIDKLLAHLHTLWAVGRSTEEAPPTAASTAPAAAVVAAAASPGIAAAVAEAAASPVSSAAAVAASPSATAASPPASSSSSVIARAASPVAASPVAASSEVLPPEPTAASGAGASSGTAKDVVMGDAKAASLGGSADAFGGSSSSSSNNSGGAAIETAVARMTGAAAVEEGAKGEAASPVDTASAVGDGGAAAEMATSTEAGAEAGEKQNQEAVEIEEREADPLQERDAPVIAGSPLGTTAALHRVLPENRLALDASPSSSSVGSCDRAAAVDALFKAIVKPKTSNPGTPILEPSRDATVPAPGSVSAGTDVTDAEMAPVMATPKVDALSSPKNETTAQDVDNDASENVLEWHDSEGGCKRPTTQPEDEIAYVTQTVPPKESSDAAGSGTAGTSSAPLPPRVSSVAAAAPAPASAGDEATSASTPPSSSPERNSGVGCDTAGTCSAPLTLGGVPVATVVPTPTQATSADDEVAPASTVQSPSPRRNGGVGCDAASICSAPTTLEAVPTVTLAPTPIQAASVDDEDGEGDVEMEPAALAPAHAAPVQHVEAVTASPASIPVGGEAERCGDSRDAEMEVDGAAASEAPHSPATAPPPAAPLVPLRVSNASTSSAGPGILGSPADGDAVAGEEEGAANAGRAPASPVPASPPAPQLRRVSGTSEGTDAGDANDGDGDAEMEVDDAAAGQAPHLPIAAPAPPASLALPRVSNASTSSAGLSSVGSVGSAVGDDCGNDIAAAEEVSVSPAGEPAPPAPLRESVASSLSIGGDADAGEDLEMQAPDSPSGVSAEGAPPRKSVASSSSVGGGAGDEVDAEVEIQGDADATGQAPVSPGGASAELAPPRKSVASLSSVGSRACDGDDAEVEMQASPAAPSPSPLLSAASPREAAAAEEGTVFTEEGSGAENGEMCGSPSTATATTAGSAAADDVDAASSPCGSGTANSAGREEEV
eukprot:CAMPEP_0115204246 /NCGR_PEP_ID=MMETSP0270-20121206/19065_1 /TAXON_ID=71861 /ORGANISM="Scrippsiella trochoidea, Strain CCMP3099" /LENGTH=1181 /DNA_ID=CAMNT_0002617729 /DNA_START=109 /DNA_END=3654 /DNA_ORIENTATION=+